jgi:adenosine deaminase
MGEEIKIWYDQEGDYLEVIFDRKKGFFRETTVNSVMEKVDEGGNILGFSILKVSVH